MKTAANPLPGLSQSFSWRDPVNRERTTDVSRLIWCVFAALLIAVSKSAFTSVSPAIVVWATAGLLLLFSVREMSEVRKLGGNPWTSAQTLTCNFYFVRYGLGTLAIYYWDSFPWEAYPIYKLRFYTLGARQNLESSCQLVMLGGLGLFMAMGISNRWLTRLLPHLQWPVNRLRFRRNLILYAPVALVMLLYLLPRLPVTFQFVVFTFGTIIYPTIAVLSQWFFSNRHGAEHSLLGFTLSAICGGSLVMGLMSGQIAEVLMPMLMIVIGYMLARRSLPWKLLLVAGPVMVLAVFPYLTLYKFASQRTISKSIDDRMALAKEQLSLTDYRMGLEMTMDRFVARMAIAEFPAVYSRYYPDVYPFLNGTSLAQEFAVLVPRFVWRDKPEISAELNKYAAQVGMIREDDGTSAVFDAISEYYVNFGLIGIFALSALHGLYLTTLDSWLTNGVSRVVGGSIFCSLFLMNHDFFGVGQLFTSHLKVLPVWIVVFYILSRAKTSAVPGPATWNPTGSRYSGHIETFAD